MAYEWDPDKARANLVKHYIRFAEAVIALEDEQALTIRDAYDEEEDRWVTLGMDAFGRILVVVYTWRGENIRIISARLATARERRQYEKSDKG
jgi:uncharacterized DUF497 family protein